MKWYVYKSFLEEREMVFCKLDETTTISGYADSLPQYQEWLAAGNTPEEWAPEEVSE